MATSGSEFQAYRLNAAGLSVGQVSSEPLTWTPIAVNSVTASEEIAPAATGTGRLVAIKLLSSAPTNIHINFGAAATTDHFPIEPGEVLILSTEQQIRAISNTGAAVNVYVMTAVV